MENANPNLTPDSDSDSLEIITQEYLKNKQKGKAIAQNKNKINNRMKQKEMEKRFILEAQKQNVQSHPAVINFYPGRNNNINTNRNRQYYRTDYLNANGLYNNYYLATRSIQNNYQVPKGIMSLNYTPENALITSRLGAPGFEYEQFPHGYAFAEGLGENNVENEVPLKTFKDNNMGFTNINGFEMMVDTNAKKGSLKRTGKLAHSSSLNDLKTEVKKKRSDRNSKTKTWYVVNSTPFDVVDSDTESNTELKKIVLNINNQNNENVDKENENTEQKNEQPESQSTDQPQSLSTEKYDASEELDNHIKPVVDVNNERKYANE